jgi:hypothetical protein
MDLSPQSTTVTTLENRDWLGSAHGTESTDTITLDLALFTEAVHYPNGEILSGTVLAKKTSSGLYGPYSGTTEEVQTITEGGSGLTSYVLHFDGQDTAAIAAAATAAQVRTALEALSNIAPGDVTVTGSASGPYTVTFGGQYLNTNVPAMTATPTGGSGTVTIATFTAGGAEGSSDGLQVAKGHLFSVIQVRNPAGKAGAALLRHGKVRVAKLPPNSGYDPAVNADVPNIIYI